MAVLGVSAEEPLVSLINRYYSDDKDLPLILAHVKAIREYAKATFPELNLLTDEEAVILSLSLFVLHHSPEKAIHDSGDRTFMEVKRALSRFHCIALLQEGEKNYERFVENQETSVKLKKEQYRLLASKYQSLDPLTLETLKVATLISSVPLSSEAKKRADNILGKNNYIIDSVEFPATVFENIDNACKIYPQVEYLLQRHPDDEERKTIIEYLQSAFSHRRHYRHMLYAEGSQSMFTALVEGINNKQLTKKAFDFWILYWNTNITGFQGHIKPRGSYFLTFNTFKEMSTLESVLRSIFESEDLTPKDIFRSYLTQRASFLGLGDILNTGIELNMTEQIFLAYFGTQMKLYNKVQGQLLVVCHNIFKDVVTSLRQAIFNSDLKMPTPTYAPALFTNILDHLSKASCEEKVFQFVELIGSPELSRSALDLKEKTALSASIIIYTPIYLSALLQYQSMRENGTIAPNIPLSFQAIAAQGSVSKLLDESISLNVVDILALIDIVVSDQGVVSYAKKPDYELLLAAQIKEQHEILKTYQVQDPLAFRQPMLTFRRCSAESSTPSVLNITEAASSSCRP